MKAEFVENTNDDLMPVNAARVSFNKHHNTFTTRAQVEKGSDEGLLSYLASHSHWTPFSHIRETFFTEYTWIVDGNDLTPEETAGIVIGRHGQKVRHSLYGWVSLIKNEKINSEIVPDIVGQLCKKYPHSMKSYGYDLTSYRPSEHEVILVDEFLESDPYFIDVTMRETVPIFVARQRFKHMIGFGYNEVSRRYVDDVPTFFFPDAWRGRPTNGAKQGSSNETVEDLYGENDSDMGTCDSQYEKFIDYATSLYMLFIENGVAPEQARILLPQSMYTSYYVTGSLIAWKRAFAQRVDPHAQKEIRDLASMWKDVMENDIPSNKHNVWNRFIENKNHWGYPRSVL